jgi:hypothetical protein
MTEYPEHPRLELAIAIAILACSVLLWFAGFHAGRVSCREFNREMERAMEPDPCREFHR